MAIYHLQLYLVEHASKASTVISYPPFFGGTCSSIMIPFHGSILGWCGMDGSKYVPSGVGMGLELFPTMGGGDGFGTFPHNGGLGMGMGILCGCRCGGTILCTRPAQLPSLIWSRTERLNCSFCMKSSEGLS